MVAFQTVLEQALELPERERADLAARLLRSIPEPGLDDGGDGEELSGPAWEAAWTAELDRRVEEVESGTAELIDAEDVFAEARAVVRDPAR